MNVKSMLMLVGAIGFMATAYAVPLKPVGKIVSECVEAAAKKSGRTLSPAAGRAARQALEKCVARYGDDVPKVVSRGGLEAIDGVAKYGDEFVRLAGQSPQAARSLALHADTLMPLARRIGPDFMTLEAKVPGMGAQAVRIFGDEAVPQLIKMSDDEIMRLISYGARAESPQTAKMLLEASGKTGGRILEHLDAKRIMAYGLSAAAVTAAYRVSGGAAEAIKTSPGAVSWGIWGMVALVAGLLGLLYFAPSLVRKGWQRMKHDQEPET